MTLQRDLREFIELLNCHGVEYVVVGGYAVAFHGYPRYTGDIDFFVRASESNAERIVRVLEDFGFSDAMQLSAALSKPGQVVQLGRPPHRIDVLTSASGIDFEAVWNAAIHSNLDGIPVRFPDLQSLLANKRASGRAKDMADVEELERIRQFGQDG